MNLFCRAALALFLTTACAHAVPVSLRVVDANNKPIAGAQARIVDYADWPQASGNFLTSSEKQMGADGIAAFDLRGPADENAPGARVNDAQGLGGARVRAAGYGAVNAVLLAGENVIMLGPPARVSGVVQNEAGQPIAGARVRLRSVEAAADESDDARASSGLPLDFALTDAKGRWEIEGVARGFATFVVIAPNRVATEIEVPLAERSVVAEPIILPPAGTVKGRLLDVQGQPLAGVKVYWDGGYGSHNDVVYTDPKGEFVLDDVPLGGNTVSFFRYFSDDWMGVVEEPEVELERQGQIIDVGEVRQSAGLLLSGALFDAESRAPVGLAKLKLIGHDKSLQTDAQGRFEARVPKPFYGFEMPDDYELKNFLPDPPKGAESFDLGAVFILRKFRPFSKRAQMKAWRSSRPASVLRIFGGQRGPALLS